MGAVVSGTLAFGADPGNNEAVATIAAAGVTAANRAEAFVVVNSTASNSVDDHKTLAALAKFICECQTNQVEVTCKVDGGFYAQGDFDIEVVWN
jgi:nitrogen fixation protein FixH